MKTRFPAGSEWRRWDLQIHTPLSALNNGFGEDFDAYAKDVLVRAREAKIAAIGVTDYFVIEGYKQFLKLLQDENRLVALCGEEVALYAKTLLIVPNIEFRTSVVVDDQRVNFHVMFSDDVEPKEIEDFFLRELKIAAEGRLDEPDEQYSLSEESLSEIGRRLKEQHEEFRNRSDLYIGMLNAAVHHSQISEALDNRQSFSGKYLLCIPADEDLSKCSWDGQAHHIRKMMIQKSHFIFSGNPATRDFGLGRKSSSPDDFRAEFKSLKPCIHGSDAHRSEELFRPDLDRFTWIKADPTFLGLRQVLNEPDERLFIGRSPQALDEVASRSSRVAKKLGIRKIAGSKLTEHWFDCEISLNSGLVVVIGNRGSGKSALADILALAGATERTDAFGFLNATRFRDARANKAAQFTADLGWLDGQADGPLSLAEDPNSTDYEKVRYLPQDYLETLCNEIEVGRKTKFYREIEQVIFSHISDADQLGYGNLTELLEQKGKETFDSVSLLKGQLRGVNRQISELEELTTSEHRKSLEGELEQKQRDLDSHASAKPREVPNPQEDEETKKGTEPVLQDLEAKQQQLAGVTSQIEDLTKRDGALARQEAAANRIVKSLANAKLHIDNIVSEIATDAADLDLDVDDLITLKINTQPASEIVTSVQTERTSIADSLDTERSGSVAKSKVDLEAEIDNLTQTLDAPNRAYQAYRGSLRTWNARRAELVGDADTPGTVAYVQAKLARLEEIPGELEALRTKRHALSTRVHDAKRQLRSDYATYFGAVHEHLTQHPVSIEAQKGLSFDAEIADSGFRDAFFDLIHQGRVGPFYGREEGASKLEAMLDGADFNTAEGTLSFIDSVLAEMSGHEGHALSLQSQLRSGKSPTDLYDLLYSLGYLEPSYGLRWDGKPVEQLSPGEKGSLLLTFYLLADQADTPLVIDQPEGNLDNETVYKTLVPAIRYAKHKRQIVLVTHNPNLAITCEADQVIYAEIDKEGGNKVVYSSGAIEDPWINRKIVDVLEGTRPAFDRRGAAYHRSEQRIQEDLDPDDGSSAA